MHLSKIRYELYIDVLRWYFCTYIGIYFHFYLNVILNILQMNRCSVQVTRYIFLKGMMGMYSKRLFFSLINSGLYLKKRMSFAHILPFPANIFTRPHTIRHFLFAMDKNWVWLYGISQMKRVNIKGIFLKSPGNDATSSSSEWKLERLFSLIWNKTRFWSCWNIIRLIAYAFSFIII